MNSPGLFVLSGEWSSLAPDDNPYRAPASDVTSAESVDASEEAAEIRKAHLYHEAAVEFVGTLFVVFGGIAAIVTVVLVAMAPVAGKLLPSLLYAALMAFIGVVGVGLLMHQQWARIGAIGVSLITLVLFPMGTILGAGSLYLFLSQKGRQVMTPEYQTVIAQTPLTRSVPFVVTIWVLFIGLCVILIGAETLFRR